MVRGWSAGASVLIFSNIRMGHGIQRARTRGSHYCRGWSWRLGSIYRWQKGKGRSSWRCTDWAMGMTPAHVVKWRGRGRSGSRWPMGEREREWARAFSKYLFPFSFPRILYKGTSVVFQIRSKSNFRESCTTISSTSRATNFLAYNFTNFIRVKVILRGYSIDL
jgi:hypothetical protein